MTAKFGHITEARKFIVEHLSDDALLGRTGHLIRESLYVMPFDPSQQKAALELTKAMVEDDFPARGIRARIIDIYDIVLDYLDEQGVWEDLTEAEGEYDRDAIILMLQDTVSAVDVIAPEINRQMSEDPRADLFFLTGVGETFPFIRTHAILAELHGNKPIVLVFPGTFTQDNDGSTALNILGIPQGNTGGYYRATNVFDL